MGKLEEAGRISIVEVTLEASAARELEALEVADEFSEPNTGVAVDELDIDTTGGAIDEADGSESFGNEAVSELDVDENEKIEENHLAALFDMLFHASEMDCEAGGDSDRGDSSAPFVSSANRSRRLMTTTAAGEVESGVINGVSEENRDFADDTADTSVDEAVFGSGSMEVDERDAALFDT
jgi:hypothetical protein